MSGAADTGIVIVDHQGGGGAEVRNVRGSLIASSLQTLREAGHYERYLQKLPAKYHDSLLFCLASSWLPLAMAEQHYGACDALGLDEREMTRIGETVAQRIMGTFLGVLLRSSRGVGAAPTPWIVLRQYGRICDRLLDGGSHLVLEQGPKDALIQTRGLPLYRFRYFRVAMLGMIRGGAGVLAKTYYVKQIGADDPNGIRVSLRWV
jgi:hypothetical protein